LDAESPFGVRLADFNGDDYLDLLSVSGEDASTIQLLAGDGRGGFSEMAVWNPSGMRGAKNAAIGDFNGDGMADAVIACYRSSDIVIVLGGRDSFQTTSIPGGLHPWGLATADFNGDGADDLVVANDGSPEGVVYLSLRQPPTEN
jgi:hypothetical protein